jgi:hypothetical protein
MNELRKSRGLRRAPSTPPKAEGIVGCENQQPSKAESPKTQVVDCRNHARTVFEGAVRCGSLVDRAGTFHAYDVAGRHLGAFNDLRAAARAIPRVIP